MTWDPPAEVEEYRIVRPLGRGAMGQVYLAHDALLDRAVAIKFVGATEVGPSERDRFFTEARAIARLSHPNVVAIHRVGEVRRRPYLVSEYVRGTPLDQVARPLPWERALDIGLGLARGLAAAHRRGVLHRDLKPANVVVGDDGEAKLLDFGLAKLVDVAAPPRAVVAPSAPQAIAPLDETVSVAARPPQPALQPASPVATELGQIIGTPLYLAPELWRGEPASTRSDVYALGLLLYEMVAGAPPHAGLRFVELQDRVQQGAPPVGERAPARFAALIDACLALDPAARPETGDALCEALEALRAAPIVVDGNPYRGLATFDREHRTVFFGRASEARAAIERLRTDSLVVVAGDSGAGKSSLCRAGVIPALADAGWRVVTLVPGPRPLAALDAIAPALGDGDVLLFVDQLEELMTVADDESAALFAERLVELASGRVRVLATARADFLGRLAGLPGFDDRLARALMLLGPLGDRGLREAIVGPARALGYAFESPAMVDELVASGRRNLPLLQFALAELWDVRDERARHVPADALVRIGGVGGALGRHADNVMAGLGDDRELAWRVLVALMTAEGTRAVRTRAELAELGAVDAVESPGSAGARSNAERCAGVIEKLVRARLLTIADDRIEVIHEALFTGWPKLVAWRRAHDADVRLRDQLADAAKQWNDRGRVRGLLWRDDALAEYRAWRRRWREPPTALERAFGDASEAEARRARRTRGLALASVLVALASGLVVLDRARAAAERQNRIMLGEQAQAELDSDHATRARPYLLELLHDGDDTPANRFRIAEATRPLATHIARYADDPAGYSGLALSRDGSRIAVTDYAGIARVFAADGDKPLSAPAFSADGSLLVTAGNDHAARLWEVATGRGQKARPGSIGMDISPDGKRLYTETATRLDVWRAEANALAATYGVRFSNSLALSPDHRTLAVGGPDGIIVDNHGGVLRDFKPAGPPNARVASIAVHGGVAVGATAGGVVVWSLAAPDAAVHVASVAATTTAFAPDGEHVVVAGQGFAHVHHRTGTHLADPPLVLEGPTGNVVAVAVSRDGSRVYTASDDGAARIWDTAKGKLLGVRYVPGAANALALGPDDGELAVASAHDKELGAVTIWDVRARHETPTELDAFVADYVPYKLDDNDVVRLSGGANGKH